MHVAPSATQIAHVGTILPYSHVNIEKLICEQCKTSVDLVEVSETLAATTSY